MNKHNQLYTLIGFIVGFLVALTSIGLTNQTPHMRDHSQNSSEHMHTGNIVIEQNPPTIEMEATNISGNNVDIYLTTTNFTFAPEHADQEHVSGEGHVHIYVDDIKIGRAYGEWFHIPNLAPGTHTIRARLSTNNHKTYSDINGPIETSINVEI